MRFRFLCILASLVPIDLGITGIFIAVSGRVEVIGIDILINLLLFGFTSTLGGWWLFRPIQALLKGGGDSGLAVARINSLPRLACFWVAICTSIYIFSALALGVFVPDLGALASVPRASLIGGAVWFGALYVIYYCFFTYFAVSDFVQKLKIEVSATGVIFQPGGGHFLNKLLLVLAISAVIPSALIAMDLSIFRPLRAAQGLSVEESIFLDLLASAFLIAVSLIFVTRSLVRPVNLLRSAMSDYASSNTAIRVPVLASDEQGELAVSFNNMLDELRDRDFIRETFGRFVPVEVAGALLKQRGALAPQLQVATIMFVDIENFTGIAESHPPQHVLQILNDYFSVVSVPINQHGGVITQFQGDGMLVAFNVPIADPDHADNAVAAAQDIQRIVTERSFLGTPITVRIGISTGEVIAGAVGSDDRMSYTVHGDSVNLAARLEALNKQFSTRILIANATARVLSRSCDLNPIGNIDIRGKSEPVAVFSIGEGRPAVL